MSLTPNGSQSKFEENRVKQPGFLCIQALQTNSASLHSRHGAPEFMHQYAPICTPVLP